MSPNNLIAKVYDPLLFDHLGVYIIIKDQQNMDNVVTDERRIITDVRIDRFA